MNIVNNILKVLEEQRGFTPRKTPPTNIKNILSQIELFEMYPKIYALVALLLIALTLESCASRCKQQRRYWATHRHV